MWAASRAVILLSRWALGPLGFARVELTCGPANTASQRVAQRSGFTREEILRNHVPQRGGRRDSVMWHRRFRPRSFRRPRMGMAGPRPPVSGGGPRNRAEEPGRGPIDFPAHLEGGGGEAVTPVDAALAGAESGQRFAAPTAVVQHRRHQFTLQPAPRVGGEYPGRHHPAHRHWGRPRHGDLERAQCRGADKAAVDERGLGAEPLAQQLRGGAGAVLLARRGWRGPAARAGVPRCGRGLPHRQPGLLWQHPQLVHGLLGPHAPDLSRHVASHRRLVVCAERHCRPRRTSLEVGRSRAAADRLGVVCASRGGGLRGREAGALDGAIDGGAADRKQVGPLIGSGFRNFANYRLRLLLHCGVTWNITGGCPRPVAILRLRSHFPSPAAGSPASSPV